MNDLEQWKLFERTGNIYDYLKYTACTSESSFSQDYKTEQKEGGIGESRTNRNRNGFIHHARWGV